MSARVELKEGEKRVVTRTRFEYAAFTRMQNGDLLLESWHHPALTLLDFLLIPYIGLKKVLDTLRTIKGLRKVLLRTVNKKEIRDVLRAMEEYRKETPFKYNFFPWDYRGERTKER